MVILNHYKIINREKNNSVSNFLELKIEEDTSPPENPIALKVWELLQSPLEWTYREEGYTLDEKLVEITHSNNQIKIIKYQN